MSKIIVDFEEKDVYTLDCSRGLIAMSINKDGEIKLVVEGSVTFGDLLELMNWAATSMVSYADSRGELEKSIQMIYFLASTAAGSLLEKPECREGFKEEAIAAIREAANSVLEALDDSKEE